MTGGGDTDEFEPIPPTDFDDIENQDEEDVVESWTDGKRFPHVDENDLDPTAGASDIGGRAGEP